ncbi:replicative DNA helicase [Paenibacillus antibioticophila]|uniref:DNA 5'-3' helicase n=1 Tax=Paenibacillus antibioticophila TaxID=1274374 RepID=A0A919Y186_9BACL|nr:replicative DNA helicase [Paenibacillus antibioticophila]GIO40190.1 replicative DNA helicase [Paenibacillus antibioticophila]
MSGLYEAESSVLGSFLLQPDLMDDCYLTAEDFSDDRHALIFKYMRYVYEQDGTIDLTLMAERSGQRLSRMGGISYLSQLASSVPATSSFDRYQAVVRNAYLQHQSAHLLEAMAARSQQEGIDVQRHLADAQAKLEELSEMAPKQKGAGLVPMASVFEGHVEDIEDRANKKGMTGPPTLSKRLDSMTGGHQREDFEIVAARPSMGKTAYMGNDALAVARSGAIAAIFSAEMKAITVGERFICSLANLDSHKLRSGGFKDEDWERYSFGRDELDRLKDNLFIDETPGMTLQHIRSETKRLVKAYPDKAIVIYIDYLQLIPAGINFPSRREEVEYVSRSLKLMARQHRITVVALSQLSRGVEQRPDKRPMLSDLRDSGAIEQDGDIITFLYRDDYYNRDSEKKGIVEVIIAKGRNIGTGTVEMMFLRQYSKFAEIEKKAS